ncbi:hypothetical protein D6201_10980 [Aurantiacibacter aquimixticola]|uniref:Transporter n=1 Tax=Aurantiacibacter aquimixticola TaxID=1958945 RepID=A0A419RVL9_9SPHN|nr:hypothetical protein D6201_10980 [Aurantiacibacter aquimixticola]
MAQPVHAQDEQSELEALRAQVAQMQAREAAYEERLQQLEERLLRIEAEPISAEEALTIRGRYVPDASNPMTNLPELDGFRTAAPTRSPNDAEFIFPWQDPAPPLGAPQDDEPVQREPDASVAVEDIVQQQQGLQRSRFGADLSFGYTHFGDARINLDGFLALDAIFLGTISIDEVDSDIFTSDLTMRYSATDDLFFDASLPFLYRTTAFRSGGAGGAANEPVEATIDEWGLGDVSFGASYQLLRETARRPNLVVSSRLKFPTGQEPFGIDFIEVEGSEGNLQVPEQLATGSGVYGASIGLSALKTLDPMVVFGSVNYFRNFERNFGDIDENPGDQPGRVDVGDAFQFGAGLAFALNDKSSISMSYSQRLVGQSRVRLEGQDWQRIIGSDANVALVNLGATFGLSDRLSLVTTVGIGLTDDSPDMTVGVRLPFRF